MVVAVVGILRIGFYGRHLILDTTTYFRCGSNVVHGDVPYRDFDVEYPPAALPVFVAPALVEHEDFVRYNRLFQALMVLCGLAMLLALRAAGAGNRALLAAALAPLLLGSVVLYRFDLWPTALAVGALAALAAGRQRAAFALLAVATAAKVGRSCCCRSSPGAGAG